MENKKGFSRMKWTKVVQMIRDRQLQDPEEYRMALESLLTKRKLLDVAVFSQVKPDMTGEPGPPKEVISPTGVWYEFLGEKFLPVFLDYLSAGNYTCLSSVALRLLEQYRLFPYLQVPGQDAVFRFLECLWPMRIYEERHMIRGISRACVQVGHWGMIRDKRMIWLIPEIVTRWKIPFTLATDVSWGLYQSLPSYFWEDVRYAGKHPLMQTWRGSHLSEIQKKVGYDCGVLFALCAQVRDIDAPEVGIVFDLLRQFYFFLTRL